ncbi:3643_t:CDS:2, partial [Rhizophagus irregularis]
QCIIDNVSFDYNIGDYTTVIELLNSLLTNITDQISNSKCFEQMKEIHMETQLCEFSSRIDNDNNPWMKEIMKAFKKEEARMEKERQNETLPEEIAVDTEPELLYNVSTSDSDDNLGDDFDDSDSDSEDNFFKNGQLNSVSKKEFSERKKISWNLSVEKIDTFFERQDIREYKFDIDSRGNVFIVELKKVEHAFVIARFKNYFDVPNRDVANNPPIDVAGALNKIFLW